MIPRKSGIIVLALALTAALMAGPALAMDKEEAKLKVMAATAVVSKMMAQDDESVPQDLLKKCRAVAIFPGLIKAGFIVGGQGGTGVVLAKEKDGSYSPPAFFIMAGASLGLQIGAQSTDLMLVVMTQNGLNGLLANQVQLGGDASVAMGPVGRRTMAGTTAGGKGSDVYAYSMSKGLFAGVSLDGAGLEFDKATSKKYYNFDASVVGILLKGTVKPPPSAQKLIGVLEKYSK